MARYPTGQPVRLTTTVRDIDGELATPSALTLALARPDGTSTAYPTPTQTSTGVYHQDVPAADLSQVGRYTYVWTSTGVAAGVSVATLDVYDPYEPSALTLQDAKIHLSIQPDVTLYDAELLAWLAAIDEVIERHIGGPILTRTVTERAVPEGAGTVLLLRRVPVVSVTTIGGNPPGALDIDPDAGIVRGQFGTGPTTVVYQAGRGSAVPDQVAAAARIIMAHLWETRRGAMTRPGLSGDGMADPVYGMAFAVPNRALELLGGDAVEAWI